VACDSVQQSGTLSWLNDLVVSALGSRVAPLFHWVATLDKLSTHTASPVSQLEETGVQKGVFGA